MADSSTPFKTYTKNTYSSKNPSRTLYLILFILLLVVLGVGAAQFISSRSKGGKGAVPTPIVFSEPTSTPTPTLGLTPSPSDTETTPSVSPAASSSVDKATGLDRSKLTIDVLNGSGISGLAGTTSDKLKDLGYTIGTVGNASSSNYDKTVISVKAANKAYLALLKKDLSADYTIGTTSATFSGTADAQVIVGKE
jgi:hypothetical protein